MKRGILAAGTFLTITFGALAPVWAEAPLLKATIDEAAARPLSAIAQQLTQQGPAPAIVPHAALGLSTRLVAGYGELVAGVMPGGKAEQMGLKAGDVIQAVNGRPVVVAGTFAKSLEAAASEGSLTLKIRDARSGEVTYRSRGR